jgi:hypothetical protein
VDVDELSDSSTIISFLALSGSMDFTGSNKGRLEWKFIKPGGGVGVCRFFVGVRNGGLGDRSPVYVSGRV